MLFAFITICPSVGWIYSMTHDSFSCTLLSITAIYNIVSQRQMSGRTDSDFSPASNVVPITVEPTQNSSSKGVCCQSNWDPTTDLLLHLQAMRHDIDRQTDRERQVVIYKDTCTGFVYCLIKNKRGTSDEGIVKRFRQGVWCGRKRVGGLVPSALSFWKWYMIRNESL